MNQQDNSRRGNWGRDDQGGGESRDDSYRSQGGGQQSQYSGDRDTQMGGYTGGRDYGRSQDYGGGRRLWPRRQGQGSQGYGRGGSTVAASTSGGSSYGSGQAASATKAAEAAVKAATARADTGRAAPARADTDKAAPDRAATPAASVASRTRAVAGGATAARPAGESRARVDPSAATATMAGREWARERELPERIRPRLPPVAHGAAQQPRRRLSVVAPGPLQEVLGRVQSVAQHAQSRPGQRRR